MTNKLILIDTDTHVVVPREPINNLLSYVNSKECLHEDTYRGGAIWTICRSCGRKWADDDGGFEEYTTPKAISDVEEALAVPQLTAPSVLRWEEDDLVVGSVAIATVKCGSWSIGDFTNWRGDYESTADAKRAAEKALGLPIVEEV